MAKGVYVGISSAPRKVKEIYVGVEGVARRVKEVYIGVGGLVKKIFPSIVPAGQVIFTSSQVWIVPAGVSIVDIFCVGGGGAGGAYSTQTFESGESQFADGGGGGGGYTATHLNVAVTPLSNISAVIGAGGINHANGNTTSFGSLSVSGGEAGRSASSSTSAGAGGNGGSGGGGGGVRVSMGGSYSIDCDAGVGGANGGNGGNGWYTSGGSGQGTTTRAFGESTNTLYSNAGGFRSGDNPVVNGNGGFGDAPGASGIIIVRWAEQ